MARFVAFARGINVGGKNKLKMARLIALFQDAGAGEVVTYIQSGNVIFTVGAARAPEATAQKIADAVTGLLKKTEGLLVPLTVRRHSDLDAILKAHPFARDEEDERMVGVGFLSTKPSAALVKTLDPERSPGDRFSVEGAQLYLHTPNGSARSKLTVDYFDRTLGVVTTVRNLKTVRALAAMT